MGLFSGVGKFLKRATTIPSHGILSPLRKVFGETPLDEIGQVAGFALGGPAGAAIGGGLGSFVHNQNVGDALGNAAKGYALGTGANVVGGAIGGGLSGATGELAQAARPIVGAGKSLLGVGQMAGSLAGGSAGTAGSSGVLGGILNFAKQNPELVLGSAGLVNSAMTNSGAQAQQNQALALAKQQSDQRAPLYAALLAKLGQAPASTPDLSGIFHDPGNPFSR